MKAWNRKSGMDRRRFLKAAGISMALPMLESIPVTGAPAAMSHGRPTRFVAIGGYLGFHQASIYPEKTGFDYESTPLLDPIQDHRNEFTLFSGLDHRAKNGHGEWANYLSGKKSGDHTLDQKIAEVIGKDTRYESLQLTAGKASRSMSYTRERVALPMIQRPSVLYSKLFSTEHDRARSEYLIKSGRSALDLVLEEAGRLRKNVTASDSSRLDQYFDSVRDVEKKMERQLNGLDREVPTTDYQIPSYDPLAPNLMIEAESLMYDLMALALESDSTRVITLFLAGLGQVFTIDGVTLKAGYHALSHHGNDPDMVRDLVRVEKEHMRCFNKFLNHLKKKTDSEGKPLLDSTIVLMGTGMGDASRHSNDNLPTIVAGGGFKHGQHIAEDPKKDNALLLGDLYITLMQKLGMESDQFSNADRNMNHLIS